MSSVNVVMGEPGMSNVRTYNESHVVRVFCPCNHGQFDCGRERVYQKVGRFQGYKMKTGDNSQFSSLGSPTIIGSGEAVRGWTSVAF